MAEGNRSVSLAQSGQAPGRGLQWVIYSVLAGLLVVLLTTTYFFVRAARLEQEKSLAESDALARGVAAFIQARMDLWMKIKGVNPTLAWRTVFCTGDVATANGRTFLETTGCPVLAKPFELPQYFDAVAWAATR